MMKVGVWGLDLEGLQGQDEEQRVDHHLEHALLATMFCMLFGYAADLIKSARDGVVILV